MALSEAVKYRRRIQELVTDYGVIMDTGNPDDERLTMILDRLVKMVPPLYGAAETAEKLDVLTSNLSPSGRRGLTDLPAPVVQLRSSRLWLASEIDEFARAFKKRRQGSMEERKQRAAA